SRARLLAHALACVTWWLWATVPPTLAQAPETRPPGVVVLRGAQRQEHLLPSAGAASPTPGVVTFRGTERVDYPLQRVVPEFRLAGEGGRGQHPARHRGGLPGPALRGRPQQRPRPGVRPAGQAAGRLGEPGGAVGPVRDAGRGLGVRVVADAVAQGGQGAG